MLKKNGVTLNILPIVFTYYGKSDHVARTTSVNYLKLFAYIIKLLYSIIPCSMDYTIHRLILLKNTNTIMIIKWNVDFYKKFHFKIIHLYYTFLNLKIFIIKIQKAKKIV